MLPFVFDDPDDLDEEPAAGSVTQTRIGSLGLEVGSVFWYWYDFGDDWYHEIKVVAVGEAAPKVKYPRVIAASAAAHRSTRHWRRAGMMRSERPPVRQMIREAVEALGSPTNNVGVRDWIEAHYPGTNPRTIGQQIRFCSVNQPSRVHQDTNRRPRTANDPRYDFLYCPAPGVLEIYDPTVHGMWSIEQDAGGHPFIRRRDGGPISPEPGHSESGQANRAADEGHAGEIEIVEPPLLVLTWSGWLPLTQQGKGQPPGAPEEPGVYQIRCRLDGGECEVVYIGLSSRGVKGLRGRINNHRSRPGSCADNLVNRQRFWDHAGEPIEVRWAVTEHPHYAEDVLLRQFRDEHGGRLPRFNTDG